ncbi:MAG TPA: hypothetical protein VGL87_11470 [Steroidobacteraceae bacterium]|jgi:hypothetical protein
MPVVLESTNKFLNTREWRTFLAAAQSAASYPSVVKAVRAGRAWLSDSAAKTSSWLLVDGSLVAGARKTLGI